MPSRPPETGFYKDDANYTLWRDVSRLFEDFVGSDAARIQRFETVLRDVLVRLNENREQRVI